MAPRLYSYQPRPNTVVEHLQNHLAALEKKVCFLPQQDRSLVLAFLAEMDAAWQLCGLLVANGAPQAGELLRFATLQHQVRAKAAVVLKIIGGPAALAQARPPAASPDQQPWWFLDREVARRRTQRWKLVVRIGGVGAALALVVVILFNTLLKPDPVVVFKISRYNDALSLATQNQDFNGALAELNRALAVAPDDVELLVFKGVLLAQLNRTGEADTLFERAVKLAGGREQVLWQRGQYLRQLNRPEAALALAQEAIAVNPEYAAAWFLAGQVYMDLGQTSAAYQALSTAADLAYDQDNETLYVTARINLAHLSQSAVLQP